MTDTAGGEVVAGDRSTENAARIAPTPWHASRKSHYVNDLNNQVVAEVILRPGYEEHAALMAAAPAMRAALTLALPVLERELETRACSFDPAYVEEIGGPLRAIKAALSSPLPDRNGG